MLVLVAVETHLVVDSSPDMLSKYSHGCILVYVFLLNNVAVVIRRLNDVDMRPDMDYASPTVLAPEIVTCDAEADLSSTKESSGAC